jgi:hypothetical protein
MIRYFLILVITLICSCIDSDNTSKNDHKENEHEKLSFPVKPLFVDNGEDDGWGADIRISITSITQTDTTREYTAISSFEGRNLGLIVAVPKTKEGEKGFGKWITLKSLGIESDNLLSKLAQLYKVKDTSAKFVSSVSTAYVNLKEFAKSLGAQDGGEYTSSSEYKLFFEGNNEEDYAELYVNINPDEKWVELREKDEEYRTAIIKFLHQ